jgi:hypothetical protein|eukprot:COSAG06_NODE_24274_length_667_cov_1.617958_2_plen_81_part_00
MSAASCKSLRWLPGTIFLSNIPAIVATLSAVGFGAGGRLGLGLGFDFCLPRISSIDPLTIDGYDGNASCAREKADRQHDK